MPSTEQSIKPMDDVVPEAPRPRLLLAAGSSLTVRTLLRGQLEFCVEHGFEVHVASPPDDRVTKELRGMRVRHCPTRFSRGLNPLLDLVALRDLLAHIRRVKPDIINAGTPKASFLSLLAARLTRVPCRIYTLRGLRLETTAGFLRRLLWFTEWCTSRNAHRILAVSDSLRDAYLQLDLSSPAKIVVLANGSSNGVDCRRFHASPQALRRVHADGDPIIGFVGRCTKDKGITELIAALDLLRVDHPRLRLLLVGPEERGQGLPDATWHRILADPLIHWTGHTDEPEEYYGRMSVLVHPSHREGFPNVVLEAAACGVPAVVFDVTGSRDAVVPDQTGRVVARGDSHALAAAVDGYLCDETTRRAHGMKGRHRVESNFRQELVWDALLANYAELMASSRG